MTEQTYKMNSVYSEGFEMEIDALIRDSQIAHTERRRQGQDVEWIVKGTERAHKHLSGVLDSVDPVARNGTAGARESVGGG